MPEEPHFVQAGDQPALIGQGDGTLTCSCGQILVQGFEASRVLGISIQCSRCGTVTTTAGLPEGEVPSRGAVIAPPWPHPRAEPMVLRPGVPIVGQAEMKRLQALFEPAAPSNEYRISADLLAAVEAGFVRMTGGSLEDTAADHPLGSSVRHLRGRLYAEGWAPFEAPATAAAVTNATGFLHFLATWERHPYLPMMAGWAAERGFSVHALAPFAAAHSLMAMGNRIRWDEPDGYPERIGGFSLVSGNDPVGVEVAVFNRFEFPHGKVFDAEGLRSAVEVLIAGVQGRMNLRHPGVLVLSPGNQVDGYDEAVIEGIKSGLLASGRKNRGLMAVGMIALRLQPGADAQSVRLGYVFFPIGNRHYRGESPLQMAG